MFLGLLRLFFVSHCRHAQCNEQKNEDFLGFGQFRCVRRSQVPRSSVHATRSHIQLELPLATVSPPCHTCPCSCGTPVSPKRVSQEGVRPPVSFCFSFFPISWFFPPLITRPRSWSPVRSEPGNPSAPYPLRPSSSFIALKHAPASAI